MKTYLALNTNKHLNHLTYKHLNHLYGILLRYALLSENEDFVKDLLSRWPLQELKVQDLFIDEFCKTRLLYDETFRQDWYRKCQRMTLLILEAFVSGIQSQSLKCIREMNVAGMPEDEQLIFRNQSRVVSFLVDKSGVVKHGSMDDEKHKYTI